MGIEEYIQKKEAKTAQDLVENLVDNSKVVTMSDEQKKKEDMDSMQMEYLRMKEIVDREQDFSRKDWLKSQLEDFVKKNNIHVEIEDDMEMAA